MSLNNPSYSCNLCTVVINSHDREGYRTQCACNTHMNEYEIDTPNFKKGADKYVCMNCLEGMLSIFKGHFKLCRDPARYTKRNGNEKIIMYTPMNFFGPEEKSEHIWCPNGLPFKDRREEPSSAKDS